MEFDSVCTSIQSAFLSTEKSLNVSFVNIYQDSEEIDDIIKKVSRVFNETEIITDDLRRIHLLCLLNTDFPSVQLVAEDRNYCHLLNTLPKLSSYLYLKFLINFKWHTFLGEVIIHCPEALSLDVLKCVSTYLRELDPKYAVTFCRTLLDSLFQKIITLRGCNSVNKKYKFAKVFQTLLAFSPLDLVEDLNWKLDTRLQYTGHLVLMYLSLLEDCIIRFNKGCQIIKLELYDIKITFDYTLWDCVKTEFDWVSHALGLLISVCKKLTMSISVEMYMSWCEEELEVDCEKTLQTAVREKAYTSKELLQELGSEEFPDLPFLISTLNNFALKPPSEEDEIKVSNVDTIILNLRNPNKTQEKWFLAFLKIEDLLCNEIYLQVIKENVKLFNNKLLLIFIERVIEHINNRLFNAEQTNTIKQLVLECLGSLPVIDQVILLAEFYEIYGNNSIFLLDSFDNSLTEVLNKLVDEEDKKVEVYADLVNLSLQSGNSVIQKLLTESVNSKPKCDIAISILRQLFPLIDLVSNDSPDNARVTTMVACGMLANVANYIPQEKDNYIYLVKNLAAHSIIDGHQFLVTYAMKQFEEDLDKKDWDKILFWLNLIFPFADGSCGEGVTQKPVILLSFLLHALTKCRPKPTNFTPQAAEACELIVQLMNIVVEKLIASKTGEDSEVIWLRGIASNSSPLNWYHLRRVWTHWEQELPADDGMLTWTKPNLGFPDLTQLTGAPRASLVTQLCKILPNLTCSEWKMIGSAKDEDIKQGLALFQALADGVLVLTQVPMITKNSLCLNNIVSNLVAFVKWRTLHCLKDGTPEDAAAVLHKLDVICREVGPEIVEARRAQLLPVMQAVISSNTISPILFTTVTSLSDPTIKSGLAKHLQSSVRTSPT